MTCIKSKKNVKGAWSGIEMRIDTAQVLTSTKSRIATERKFCTHNELQRLIQALVICDYDTISTGHRQKESFKERVPKPGIKSTKNGKKL